MSTPILPSPCPSCGRLLDMASGVAHGPRVDDEALPSPGDLTMCLCGHLLAFGDDMRLREPTSAEMREAAGDDRLLAISRAIAGMRRGG